MQVAVLSFALTLRREVGQWARLTH